jgi:hypothetical protein
MARFGLFATQLIPSHLAFLILLEAKFVADTLRFPVDGLREVTAVMVALYVAFYGALHFSLRVMFRCVSIDPVKAGWYATLVMGVYMFTHFFEGVFYAGGRAEFNPPASHFIENLLTAFLGTGDAGFWQVMRIFICGPLTLLLLFHERVGVVRAFVGVLWVYLIGMLLTHPDVWAYYPGNEAELYRIEVETGMLSYADAAYDLLFIGIIGAAVAMRCPGVGSRLGSYGLAVVGWLTGGNMVATLFVPEWLDIPMIQVFVTVLCITVLAVGWIGPLAARANDSHGDPQALDPYSLFLCVCALGILGVSAPSGAMLAVVALATGGVIIRLAGLGMSARTAALSGLAPLVAMEYLVFSS